MICWRERELAAQVKAAGSGQPIREPLWEVRRLLALLRSSTTACSESEKHRLRHYGASAPKRPTPSRPTFRCMSATTNLFYNLEHRLSHLRGERETAATELRSIEESVARLSTLHERLAALDKAIAAAEALLLHDRPDWQSERVKAVKPRVWKSPFKSGEVGRTALGILRERDDWLRPIEIARIMLERIGHDPEDRSARERLANTVGAYLKSHENELVESQGDYAKQWRVIRPDRDIARN